MYLRTYINVTAFERGSLCYSYIHFLCILMLNLIFRHQHLLLEWLIIFQKLPLHEEIFFTNSRMVWYRDFGFLFSFAQYCSHSFNSCWKADGVGKPSLWYSNASGSSSALYFSKLSGMILTAWIAEVSLAWNLSLTCFLSNLKKVKQFQ